MCNHTAHVQDAPVLRAADTYHCAVLACSYVKLDSTPGKMPSDGYAFDVACGQRVLASPNTASGQAAAAAGADGKRNASPGWLLSRELNGALLCLELQIMAVSCYVFDCILAAVWCM
jgi:hypothetical protein